MKSSTLYRSNISREKVQQIEEFKLRSGAHRNISYDENTPSVYVRPKKEKELDTLLNGFNVSSTKEKTPAVYLVSGFLVGAVCMFMMMALVTFSAKEPVIDESYTVPPLEQKESKGLFNFAKKEHKQSVTIIPADTAVVESTPVMKSENYTVKSGDTLEAIIIRFYGKYDASKVAQIAAANKMANPNSLQIGQKLIIPMD